MSQVFTNNYRVMYSDAGYNCRLTIPALCNYVLDCAGLHAMQLGCSMRQLFTQNYTWVISGLKVIFNQMPEINDNFSVETLISDCNDIITKRDFRIKNLKNGKLIAEVSTNWLIINIETRKPVFISEIIGDFESDISHEFYVSPHNRIRKRIDDNSQKITKIVGLSDIDINKHFYSVRYITYALDTLELSFYEQNNIQELTADFISEVKYGQQITIQTQNDNAENVLVEIDQDNKTSFKMNVKYHSKET